MVAMFVLVIAFGNFFTVTMMSRALFSGTTTTSMISGFSMIPQVVFFAWACVFVIMTPGRSPSTPIAASAMIAIWALTSAAVQMITRYVIAHNTFDLASQATLLHHLVIEVVLVAAFCGYMSGGHRPNVYFRRRVSA